MLRALATATAAAALGGGCAKGERPEASRSSPYSSMSWIQPEITAIRVFSDPNLGLVSRAKYIMA